MTQFKGSILELNNKKAVVMTDRCDFITVKRTPDMFLGQQLTFNETTPVRKPVRKASVYFRSVALSAAVFALALLSVVYFQVFSPVDVYAYIDLDINPSMEFSVDKASNVLEVKALNSDARNVLKQLELEDIPVKEAISQVIASSKNLGYISIEKNNEVLISATLEEADSASAAAEEKSLSSMLSDIESLTIQVGEKSLQPEVIKVTSEVRKAAVKNKISMGRYKLYEDIKETDSSLTIEKAKTERVSDMLGKVKIKKDKIQDKNGKANDKDNTSKTNNDKDDKSIDTDTELSQTTSEADKDTKKNEAMLKNNTNNPNAKKQKDSTGNFNKGTKDNVPAVQDNLGKNSDVKVNGKIEKDIGNKKNSNIKKDETKDTSKLKEHSELKEIEKLSEDNEAKDKPVTNNEAKDVNKPTNNNEDKQTDKLKEDNNDTDNNNSINNNSINNNNNNNSNNNNSNSSNSNINTNNDNGNKPDNVGK